MAEETKNDGGSVLDEDVASKLFEEIAQGYRSWEYGDAKYRTRFPNAAEDSEARIAYAKQFNKNLEEGLLTQKQMGKLLTSRGIWTDEDEVEVTKLREKISSVEAILAKKSIHDKSKTTRKLVEELAQARVDLFEKTSSFQDYMNQTVEQIAEERRTAYLISSCTTKEDGSHVWESVDKFMNETDSALVGTATYQYVTFTNGLAENYIEELTEVKFLRAGQEDESDAAPAAE